MLLIEPRCDIRGMRRMQFGEHVVIQCDCWLDIAYDNPHPGPMIVFGESTNIGKRCTISAANSVVFGKAVLVGHDTAISDTGHEYRDPLTPIMFQGLTTLEGRTIIGDGTWIGSNCMIGPVSIGKNCVIGFGSFVNKDIPDYSVAVGCPAKVIKTYDFNKKQWVRV